MQITACWIVKNEAGTLPLSAESVRAAADELVVVDTGSTDGTVAVAEALGARVESFGWTGDFSAARNFALGKAAGDIVVFLDADEWFEPALTAADRAVIGGALLPSGAEVMQVRRHNLTAQGAVINTTVVDRVLRRGGLRYFGRVHEQLLRENGEPPRKCRHDAWRLNHSGYAGSLLDEKLRRNIEILEEMAAAPDEEERFLAHCYLVREYRSLGGGDGMRAHLPAVLGSAAMLRLHCRKMGEGFIGLLYAAIDASSRARESVSRLEVRQKLFSLLEKQYPRYPGAPTAALYYEALFALREDRLLAGIDRALAESRRLPAGAVSYHREAETRLCHAAAAAALRRGGTARALGYAVSAVKSLGGRYNRACLRLLLQCVRGQPAGEIALFLGSLYDTGDLDVLRGLAADTLMEGCRDIFLYYNHKLLEQGAATQGDYLYYLLLLGKHAEALEHALSLGEENAGAVSRHIFLHAVCTGDEAVRRQNEGRLAGYERILDSYFSGRPLQDLTAGEVGIYAENYRLVAFAAGVDAAERFRLPFRSDPGTCLQVKAAYCVEGGLFGEVLQEDLTGIGPGHLHSRIYVLSSLLAAGRDAEVLAGVKALLGAGAVSEEAFHILLAAAERSGGEIRRFCDEAFALFDRAVDLRDVVNTGYTADTYTKKQLRALAALPVSRFLEEQEALAASADIPRLPELCEKAGLLYSQKGLNGPAQECLRLCVVKGHHADENRERLAGVFRALGNGAVARSLS